MQKNIAAIMIAGPHSQRNHGRLKVDSSAETATGHGPQLATGPVVASVSLAQDAVAKLVEEEVEEEGKDEEKLNYILNSELRGAQDQLKRRLEVEDYTGAADAKESIAALKRQADLRRAQDQLKKLLEKQDYTGAAAVQESITALTTGSNEASATLARDADADAKHRTNLLRAKEQLEKCLEKEDYRGASAAQKIITTLMGAELCSHRVAETGGTVAPQRRSYMEASKGELSSIQYLADNLPKVCDPVCLENLTLLCIGKVSNPPNSDKGKGQGKGQSEKGNKGKKGKKGKDKIEKGMQQIQPVYFGDDKGRVICILATGDGLKQIPATVPQDTYVDITSLKPQSGQLGVLYWTERTQMSLRPRPRDSGCNYIFPYDVTSNYSNDFASMAFMRECTVGTYVAIAMRITDAEQKYNKRDDAYLSIEGFDTEGEAVGPLRLWKYEEGDINPGDAYVVRGLKVVHDRVFDDAKQLWTRSNASDMVIECSPRTACENVEDIRSITECL